MEEVFIIDGEDEESVQSDIRKHLNTVRASSKANNSMENSLVNDADSVSVGIVPGGCYVNDSQRNSIVDNGAVCILILLS